MGYKNPNIVLLIVVMLIVSNVHAQPMDNNSAPDRAKNKIKKEIGYYQHNEDEEYYAGATCKMWIKEFDTKGRLIKFMDHWQCGKPYCFYEYEYDKDGKCINSWISYYTNNFKRTAMKHKYDANGNTIRRWASKNIPTYPIYFTYTFNANGQMTKYEEWRKKDGENYVDYSSTWNNDPSFDLRTEYKVFEKNGDLKWIVKREFEYYE